MAKDKWLLHQRGDNAVAAAGETEILICSAAAPEAMTVVDFRLELDLKVEVGNVLGYCYVVIVDRADDFVPQKGAVTNLFDETSAGDLLNRNKDKVWGIIPFACGDTQKTIYFHPGTARKLKSGEVIEVGLVCDNPGATSVDVNHSACITAITVS